MNSFPARGMEVNRESAKGGCSVFWRRAYRNWGMLHEELHFWGLQF